MASRLVSSRLSSAVTGYQANLNRTMVAHNRSFISLVGAQGKAQRNPAFRAAPITDHTANRTYMIAQLQYSSELAVVRQRTARQPGWAPKNLNPLTPSLTSKAEVDFYLHAM
jgi:hypothetical protein